MGCAPDLSLVYSSVGIFLTSCSLIDVCAHDVEEHGKRLSSSSVLHASSSYVQCV